MLIHQIAARRAAIRIDRILGGTNNVVVASMDQALIASPVLPGGDLVSALFDREVMSLADRGGASNLVGDRWADLAAAHAATWVADLRPIHAEDGELVPIVRVDRLDDTPAVAAAASRRGLQNPDLLLIGERDGRPVVQAADAKFSIETARSKQVSVDVVRGLLELRSVVPGLLAEVGDDPAIEPGIFLSPDFPLTHLMLRRKHGIVRTTVRPDEVALTPAPPDVFWDGVEGAPIMAPLAAVDRLPVGIDDSLLAGLYYFRLARAAVGCWLDATKPLLLHDDTIRADVAAIRDEAIARGHRASSAIGLILRWNADVQTIRQQRAAVDQVAGFPIPGRELREMAMQLAAVAGVEPPSVNQVRRRVGAWYRAALRERVGPISPPVADLASVLRQIGAAGRDLSPELRERAECAILELIAQNGQAEPVAAGQTSRNAGEK
jgi:hypothetical protein